MNAYIPISIYYIHGHYTYINGGADLPSQFRCVGVVTQPVGLLLVGACWWCVFSLTEFYSEGF